MAVVQSADEAIGQRRAQLTSELRRFIAIVTVQMQPERIILFGSFATGHIKEWSDLDLVVVAHTDLPFYHSHDSHDCRRSDPQLTAPTVTIVVGGCPRARVYLEG